MSEMHLARLCFDPSGGDQFDTAMDHRLHPRRPDPADVATTRDDYSYEQRLSWRCCIWSHSSPGADERPRPPHSEGDLPDEAWADHVHPEGAKLVPE